MVDFVLDIRSELVHPTTENAMLFTVPGALATLDLGLSSALVCLHYTESLSQKRNRTGSSVFHLYLAKLFTDFNEWGVDLSELVCSTDGTRKFFFEDFKNL